MDKRTQIAAMVLQGLLSGKASGCIDKAYAAKEAVEYTDALLNALAPPGGHETGVIMGSDNFHHGQSELSSTFSAFDF